MLQIVGQVKYTNKDHNGDYATIVWAPLAGAQTRAGASPAPTVCDIVGAYKSLVANRCLDIYKSKNEMMGKLWQRNYYEHILRNDFAYNCIADYIIQNPDRWLDDIYFPQEYRSGEP